jgi:hypothetical protein
MLFKGYSIIDMKLTTPPLGTAFQNDDQDEDLNADFSVPAMIDTRALNWHPSPVKGVMRKRLELIALPEPRITTLVQFSSGSSFKQHLHSGGEEFLVLSGTFSDETGDYGEGCYIRNPPGSFHTPFTDEGCQILVKLGQFQENDDSEVVIRSKSHSFSKTSSTEPGVSQLDLHQFLDETVSLFRINPNCWMNNKSFPYGVEIFVYQGSISDGECKYYEGCWLRYPAGSKIKFSTVEGAQLYMKQGNFPDLVAAKN